jgi:hypothetical protein
MPDSMFDKVKYKYWDVVPYDYRPSNIWYKFKCWSWKRYTTVKPRYLGHGWQDRGVVLPHMMFEILSEFIEKECNPEIIDWEASDHKVEVNGKKVNVRQEMQELYDWWHNIYQKEYEQVRDMLFKEADKHEPIEDMEEIDHGGETMYKWNQRFNSEEDEEIYHRCVMACNKLEKIQSEELQQRMHRLVNLTPYLWT